MMMKHHSPGSHAAFTEKVTNCFDTINRAVYEKSTAGTQEELMNCCEELAELLEMHPHHPQAKALFAEQVPYLVCSMDYNLRLLQRSTTETKVLEEKNEALLLVFALLNKGGQQEYMPADCKLPESFLIQERFYLQQEMDTLDKQWQQLQLQLPAPIALEPVVKITESAAWQVVTYGQWLYARNLLFHMKEMLNLETRPVTQEAIVKRLLALRNNTYTFSNWFIQDIQQKVQRACSLAEKKSYLLKPSML